MGAPAYRDSGRPRRRPSTDRHRGLARLLNASVNPLRRLASFTPAKALKLCPHVTGRISQGRCQPRPPALGANALRVLQVKSSKSVEVICGHTKCWSKKEPPDAARRYSLARFVSVEVSAFSTIAEGFESKSPGWLSSSRAGWVRRWYHCHPLLEELGVGLTPHPAQATGRPFKVSERSLVDQGSRVTFTHI